MQMRRLSQTYYHFLSETSLTSSSDAQSEFWSEFFFFLPVTWNEYLQATQATEMDCKVERKSSWTLTILYLWKEPDKN